MDIICATEVPTPKGHYSHAVVSNGLLFVSGVLPDALESGAEDTFERQVRCVFERCEQILRAGSSSLSHVVQCTIYISDVSLWASFNEIYASIFGSHKPARAVVPVQALHYGFKVEVQVVAEVSRP